VSVVERAVLDTSVIIRLDQLRDPSALPQEPVITTVTLAELSIGPLAAADDVERAGRQARLQMAELMFEALPFDAEAARAFGHVAAAMRSSGRKITARSFDALIAATALAHDLPVFTANLRDFDGIDGLTVVPVAVDR